MSSLRWIFFDVGGTLIDESEQEAHVVAAIRTLFEGYGLYYDDETIYGKMIEASVAYLPPKNEAIRRLAQTQEQHQAITATVRYPREKQKLYPGVAETLASLAKKYRLGTIGNQHIGAQDDLERLGIHRHFSVFALSGDLGFSKPDKRIFTYALQEAGCRPQEALMVGDRLDNDIGPAKALGFQTAWVMQGLGGLQTPRGPSFAPNITLRFIRDIAHIL